MTASTTTRPGTDVGPPPALDPELAVPLRAMLAGRTLRGQTTVVLDLLAQRTPVSPRA